MLSVLTFFFTLKVNGANEKDKLFFVDLVCRIVRRDGIDFRRISGFGYFAQATNNNNSKK